MANKNIFSTHTNYNTPVADYINEAGGKAYKLSDKSALAQYAVTGVFAGMYYTSAKTQFDRVLELANKVDSKFIAKLAVYSRKQGFMKDMPAFLCAVLAGRKDADSNRYLKSIFYNVIDNGKMLRNFVQIVRSGAVGRKSFGTSVKKLINGWFAKRSADRIFTDSIGNDPSMADVIKMSHPKPVGAAHEALYGYLLGKNVEKRNLPAIVKSYEDFKKNPDSCDVPNVPFQFLSSLDIPKSVWKEIARNAGWHMTRMNLNTFARHDVLRDAEMVDLIANRLRDAEMIRKSRVFPYQLLSAYVNATDIPKKISNALQDAMEISLENVPSFGDNVFILPDVSGSMSSPITGYRGTATSKVTCHQVAALFASAVLRTTPNAEVMPFECRVVPVKLNPRDSVMTNTQKLSRVGGGGTNCSAPLEKILASGQKVDTIIYISDNESWMDDSRGRYHWRGSRGTSAMELFGKIRKKNKNAKCVCIDIAPYDTTQMSDNDNILNVGGFNDKVFNVVSMFVEGDKNHWVEQIERSVEI